MLGQNSFSNNNVGGPIVSSGTAAPAPEPSPSFQNAAVRPEKEKKPIDKKLILVAAAAAIVGAGISLGVMAIVNNSKSEDDGSHRVTVYDTETVTDGTKTVEETIETFDSKISSASTTEDKVEETLGKVGYLQIMEQWSEALAALDGIDTSSLNDYNLYRVYSNYAAVYRGLGKTSDANRYQKLADDAHSRDFASATTSTEE